MQRSVIQTKINDIYPRGLDIYSNLLRNAWCDLMYTHVFYIYDIFKPRCVWLDMHEWTYLRQPPHDDGIAKSSCCRHLIHKLLPFVAVSYSVLQYIVVCCRVLQCVAVCCSVLQCMQVWYNDLQCAAVCCSVLQCVAVCCSEFTKLSCRRHQVHIQQKCDVSSNQGHMQHG